MGTLRCPDTNRRIYDGFGGQANNGNGDKSERLDFWRECV